MNLTPNALAERYETALRSLADSAEAYYFQGRLDDAYRLWQNSALLLSAREIRPVDHLTFLLRYGAFLVHRYFLTNQEEELMLDVIEQARQLSDELQNEPGCARVLALTSEALYYHNHLNGEKDFTKVRAYFQQAAALYEKIVDFDGLAEAIFYTGMTYVWHGEMEEARTYLLRTLELAEQHNNLWIASEANRHLADVAMRKDKNYDQALRHALKSLVLREEMGFKRAIPSGQLLVSDVYIELGDYEQALASCQQADQLSREMDLPTYTMGAYMTRGEIAYRRGQHAEARGYFEQAAALARKHQIAYGIEEAEEKLALLAHASSE